MRGLHIKPSITNRDGDSLGKYLTEVAKINLLTPEEEVELAQRIKNGDQAALDKLVQSNLRFVISVAKQYQNKGLPLSDLINEGNRGLIKAAQKFDETKGFKFISYAIWWIRQSILQELPRQNRLIPLPSNQIRTLQKIKNEATNFLQKHEREPSIEELCDLVELLPDEVKYLQQIAPRHLSLDEPLPHTGDGTATLGDRLHDDQAIHGEAMFTDRDGSIIFEDVLSKTQENNDYIQRNREIVAALLGVHCKYYQGTEPMDPDDVAQKYNLTSARVLAIKKRYVESMLKALETNPDGLDKAFSHPKPDSSLTEETSTPINLDIAALIQDIEKKMRNGEHIDYNYIDTLDINDRDKATLFLALYDKYQKNIDINKNTKQLIEKLQKRHNFSSVIHFVAGSKHPIEYNANIILGQIALQVAKKHHTIS